MILGTCQYSIIYVVVAAIMSGMSKDFKLPSMEELTMPELELSSPVLKASAHHFGKFCDLESKVSVHYLVTL